MLFGFGGFTFVFNVCFIVVCVHVFYMVATHLKEIAEIIPNIEKFFKSIQGNYGKASNFDNSMFKDFGNGLKSFWNALGPTIPNQVATSGANVSGQEQRIAQTNNLYIHGGNAKDIAKEIDDRLTHHLKLAFYQNSGNY